MILERTDPADREILLDLTITLLGLKLFRIRFYPAFALLVVAGWTLRFGFDPNPKVYQDNLWSRNHTAQLINEALEVAQPVNFMDVGLGQRGAYAGRRTWLLANAYALENKDQ